METCKTHSNCIDLAVERAQEICITNGLQLTKLRKSILRLIWNSHAPIKAYDILDELKKDQHQAQPITVYRILDFFLENKLIHKLEVTNSYLGCSHPGEDHNCYFLVCKKCKMVEEACDEDILNSLNTLSSKKEFIKDKVTLEIYGTCSSCSTKQI